MLDMYEVTDPGRRRRLAELAREGQRKGWWTEHRDLLPAGATHYLGLEQAASLACAWAVQVVPALLQTEAYAAAACRAARPQLSPAGVRDLVTVSKRRQAVLGRAGFRLHAVLDESVLRRIVGSQQVISSTWRGSMSRSLPRVDLPNDLTSISRGGDSISAEAPA
jgi:hypothetical protein